MFTWVDGNAHANIVTLYTNNFTLNNCASEYFKDVRWCCIGIDEKEKKVAIRPVTKREVDLNIIPLKRLHKVSVGKGYTRISNKSIIETISSFMNFEMNGIKFGATYDEKEKLLIIDLNEPLS